MRKKLISLEVRKNTCGKIKLFMESDFDKIAKLKDFSLRLV